MYCTFLHPHEKVTALALREAVAGVLLAQPLDLGALLRRAGQRRPRKPFSDRSHGLPPSLTFTLHDCKYSIVRSACWEQ